MVGTDITKSLSDLGLTPLEAVIYVFLLRESPATGYRIAQGIGKPVANTYKAIESLQLKGAILVDEGTTRLCRAVPVAEFLGQITHNFASRVDVVRSALLNIEKQSHDDRIYHLKSTEQVFERCRRMIRGAKEIILADVFPDLLVVLESDLEEAAARKLPVLVKGYRAVDLRGPLVVVDPRREIHSERWLGQWLILIVDGREHLIALLSHDTREVVQAVWSCSAFLSWVVRSGVFCDIVMTTLWNTLKSSGSASGFDEALSSYLDFRAQEPSQYELIVRLIQSAAEKPHRPDQNENQ
jgi:sugar-specific transcriptional regulator TrmB